jgi:NADH:ubiquinone oxidoreductase subunit D
MNALKFLIEGGMVADIVAILGGLNVVAGELDR